MIKVLIADDHEIVIDGLRALLATEKNIEVVGEVGNGKAAISFLKHQEVDVILLDITMPQLDGVETSKIILRDFPGVKVIILTMHSKKELILQLMQEGVSGYILKSKSSDEVVKAINKAHLGRRHFGEDIIDLATQRENGIKPNINILTKREKDVLKLIGECYTSRKISDELFISVATVETHVRNLLGKLELESRLHLVRFAVEHGYTKAGEDQKSLT